MGTEALKACALLSSFALLCFVLFIYNEIVHEYTEKLGLCVRVCVVQPSTPERKTNSTLRIS